MPSLVFTLKSAPHSLRTGLAAVLKDHPQRFGDGNRAIDVTFVENTTLPEHSLSAQAAGGAVTIEYHTPSCAFRALGVLLAAEHEADLTFAESSPFPMRGLMIDCSRNGVMTPHALEAFMRRVALMGVNMIMLYAEDTYEIPGEPFFGYLRGRYTQQELKAIDDYAHALGIEMIPCIQTLGHMEQTLKWNHYAALRDTDKVLLADDEDSYAFIRKMIRAASAPVRSKRIHVGMDEAHGLGSGRYKDIHGERRPFDIMNDHLARVRDICLDEGLQPMIWSDMYFRLGSKTHGYYDMDWQIPADVVKDIPKDVQLVYWDYYHEDVETYRKMIAFHRQLGSEPIMGGGIWTWSHLWCALPWALTAVEACMTACRQEGLKEVFMTLWGDDGMEVDIFSALPAIQCFCEHAFTENPSPGRVSAGFLATCDAEFDEWVHASGIDSIPSIREPGLSRINGGKGLLWQDPFLALLDPQTRGLELRRHYAELAERLNRSAAAGGLSARLQFPAHIARVLSLKVDIRRDMATAYREGDRAALQRIVEDELPELRDALDELWNGHRNMWMSTYKPFGWEVVEHRYGGLHARLATVAERLSAYLQGSLNSIPELEAELLDAWPHEKGDLTYCGHATVKSPSCIK